VCDIWLIQMRLLGSGEGSQTLDDLVNAGSLFQLPMSSYLPQTVLMDPDPRLGDTMVSQVVQASSAGTLTSLGHSMGAVGQSVLLYSDSGSLVDPGDPAAINTSGQNLLTILTMPFETFSMGRNDNLPQ